MTSADFCSGLREDYSSPQSISVARHFPGHGADLPGEDREWSLHKRDIYPILWFTGLCCVVPARPREVGLLCRSCSSPRSAVAGCLQPSPHGDARAFDSSFSSCILRLMNVHLRQGTCTPLTHAHAGRTPHAPPHRRPVAVWEKLKGPILAARGELERLGHSSLAVYAERIYTIPHEHLGRAQASDESEGSWY